MANSASSGESSADGEAITIMRTESVSRVQNYVSARTTESRKKDVENMSDFRKACNIVEQFKLSDNELRDGFVKSMLVNMHRGLAKATHEGAKGIFLNKFL